MCHVLIIEDEWIIAEHLSWLAEKAGATSTVIVVTEDEAVEAAREKMPDIIFSDVKLLVGTGPCAVQTIVSQLGNVPVIFITATPGDCQPCAQPGVILLKPVDATCLGSGPIKQLR